MATRQIEIKITGESGQYEATVQRIIDKNNQLNRAAVQGAEQTTQAFGGLQRILINLPSLFGGIAAGIASAFSVGAIVSFTKQILNAAGEIDDLAKKTGFSRQTLSGLKSTIEENGGSLQAFATAINKAQKSLGDIEGDGKKAGEALKAMGLNVNDLTKATPEQFFEKFAQSLSQVEGQNQRVAIATRVMGRAGADQIPIILELTDKFKTLREQGVSDDAIKQLDKFGDAFTRLKNSALGLAQEGLAALITGFDRLFKISDIEKQRGALADYAKTLEDIDKTLKTRESLRSKGLGFLTGSNDEELLARRSKALQDFIDANDKLIRLEQAGKDKPTVGGGSLPAVDEGAAKRQLDALEAAKTKLLQLKLANAEAARAAGDLTIEVRSLAVALIEQEYNAAITAAKGNKSYTDALGVTLAAEKELKIAQFDSAEALKNRTRYIEESTQALAAEAEDAKTTAEAWGFYTKSLENATQEQLKAIDLEKQIADLEADRLGILGRTSEAESVRLANQLKYLEALKEAEGVDSKNAKLREAQIKNVITQQQQLGVVTVNVGQTIANSVGDAFEGVILGTRKLADVGKGFLTALIRDVGSFFAQALVKKLGFEQILLTNASGFLPQLTGLFSSAGGGGGGFLSGIASLFGGLFGGGGGPVQLSGPGVSPGSPQGGGGGGGFGSVIGTIGSIGSTLSTLLTSTELGATIASSIASMATTVTTTITATLDTIMTSLATIPVWGWIAAAVIAVISGIYRIIANQQERPNVKLSGIFQGVSFDETMQQFVPGDINVNIGRKVGIKNSQAGAIADNLQARLLVLANQWTDILNIFPDFIADDIQPALDETNRRLNQNFKDLKFSPGGSRSIQQELESLSGYAGLFRFFQAFAPSIEQGFRSSLQRGGVQFGSAAGFANIDPNRGFKFGAPQKDWDDFIKAIKDVAGLTSQLGSIGAGKFLTPSDLAGIGSLFDQLFSVSDATTFTKAAAEIQEKLKPALDFLSQSMQESTDLFGRGLIAALEAATASDANHAFLENLGKGVKDKIFSGIVESFIASAQFGDLLAPIQQTIREFTQQAITTGETPDIAAFRRAIIPNIEEISTRATTLAPLIGALQDFGFTITDLLTRINLLPAPPVAETPPAPVAPTTNNVTINIENYTNEDDPATLGRRIADLLGGRTAPPV